MFLKRSSRRKNGREHHYWSLVENKRVSGGRVVQRHALYLGEINSRQEAAWRKTIEVLEAGQPRARTIALFPEERAPQTGDENIVGVRLPELELHRPGHGVRAGGRAGFTASPVWTGSGGSGCVPAARARRGTWFFKRWSLAG
jgi:hypothetical protein